MSLDFNGAPAQQGFDLLPNGALCKVYMTVRPGGASTQAYPGGFLKKANLKEGQEPGTEAMYLDCEFTISSAPYAGRKIWQNFTLVNSEKAANISAGFLRGALNSARNIKPDDDSERARSARIVQGLGDFTGLEFAVRLGVQKGTGGYQDKNSITAAIEPGGKDYERVMAGETVLPGNAGGASANAHAYQAPAATPGWAAAGAPAAADPAKSSLPSWAQ